ncbi:MAG: thymidine kinase [Candidatus Marinimicrobia bacterium]|nr:thymidine kinase [Candidatus Neomarinimicrobiota bacterium]
MQEVMVNRGNKSGWIEVICGSMFSGKTEELIRRLKRAKIANQKVEIIKPKIDTRYSEEEIVSHDKSRIESRVLDDSSKIYSVVKDCQVVGIDEVQFFDNDIVDVCRKLANQGLRVIVAGLDKDYRGVPFEPVPELLCEAEYITKTQAICMKCGGPANFTQRITKSSERVLLGAKDKYEARCRTCFEPPEED